MDETDERQLLGGGSGEEKDASSLSRAWPVGMRGFRFATRCASASGDGARACTSGRLPDCCNQELRILNHRSTGSSNRRGSNG